jgi:hypothetical protein
MFLSVMHVHVTSLSAMTEDHAAEMPLVGKLTMHYLKTTSHDENKPVTLTVSVSPLLGGKSVDIPIELAETEIPDLINLIYVSKIIASKKVFQIFLEELRNENIDRVNIRVCLYFDGLPSHREKINGFDGHIQV